MMRQGLPVRICMETESIKIETRGVQSVSLTVIPDSSCTGGSRAESPDLPMVCGGRGLPKKKSLGTCVTRDLILLLNW
jgi:hypothetical protein